MKNKLVMAMITVVLASECFAGCSKKTIENSAASNASVLEENEKETENAKKTKNAEEMPEKLKTGNTEEMLENISEDTEKNQVQKSLKLQKILLMHRHKNMSWKIRDMSIPPTAISVS